MIWRIRERSAFSLLASDGQRARAGVLWCTYILDPLSTHPQVAYALGRAVGPAVVRNRIRRRLRHLLAATPPPGGTFLIGARPTAAARSGSELAKDVAQLVARLRA